MLVKIDQDNSLQEQIYENMNCSAILKPAPEKDNESSSSSKGGKELRTVSSNKIIGNMFQVEIQQLKVLENQKKSWQCCNHVLCKVNFHFDSILIFISLIAT